VKNYDEFALQFEDLDEENSQQFFFQDFTFQFLKTDPPFSYLLWLSSIRVKSSPSLRRETLTSLAPHIPLFLNVVANNRRSKPHC
jgi:hypothetical protein